MQPSDAFKLRKAFFHALGKANTEATQEVYESLYKSLGNITSKDVWIDIIPYCATETDADNFANSNPDIIKKYTEVTLKEVGGSNGQAWYYEDTDGKWIRPWISPVDIPDPTTNMPSSGFQLKLYDESGNLIPPTLGVWIVDYYSGMIYFQEGYTPSDQGWGNIKATFYAYIGKTLLDTSLTGTKLNTYIVTNPYEVGESIDITTGNGSNGGTSNIIRSSGITLPTDEATFNNDNSISIWINGEKLEKTTEINYIDSIHISFNIPLDIDDIFEIQKI